MIVLLNGEFVPESEAMVSVFDRGFLYGDGLFETLLIRHGIPFRWHQHMERFQGGLELLKLRCPFDHATLRRFAESLVEKNNHQDAILRIHLSRGVGLRGYSPKGADIPTFVMSLHALQAGAGTEMQQWKIITSKMRQLAEDPLSTAKTSDKLRQVLARMEADEQGADDALLLNSAGDVSETTCANVFWIEGGRLHTPPARVGILPGVTREVVMRLAPACGLTVLESQAGTDRLLAADAVLLTLSSLGIVEVKGLDGRPVRQSTMVRRIFEAYWANAARETAAE